MKAVSPIKALRRGFVLLTAATLLLAGCAQNNTQPQSNASGAPGDAGGEHVVRVIHVPSTLFAPLYVANARGYFKDVGISLDLQTMKSGQDAIPLVSAGKADVLVAGFGSGLFSAIQGGLGVRVVASMGGGGGEPENSPTALMVSKKLVDDGTIETVADLKGHTVALSGGPGGAGAYQFAAIANTVGLSIKDVKIVNLGFGDMAGAIQSGAAEAALPPAPFTTAMVESGVAVQFALPPKGTIASGVLYGESFLKSPDAQPFYDALVKGADDLAKDPRDPEILKILADATGQDLKVLEANPSYVWFDRLAPATDQLKAQQQVYRDAGLFDFPDEVPISDIVDSSFSENTK